MPHIEPSGRDPDFEILEEEKRVNFIVKSFDEEGG